MAVTAAARATRASTLNSNQRGPGGQLRRDTRNLCPVGPADRSGHARAGQQRRLRKLGAGGQLRAEGCSLCGFLKRPGVPAEGAQVDESRAGFTLRCRGCETGELARRPTGLLLALHRAERVELEEDGVCVALVRHPGVRGRGVARRRWDRSCRPGIMARILGERRKQEVFRGRGWGFHGGCQRAPIKPQRPPEFCAPARLFA